MSTKISFVIPCYCSERTIETVVGRIEKVMNEGGEYEVILVNDCSKDGTWRIIRELAGRKSNIMAINLAKNVGQHAAIMAGMNHVSGDLIVTLDDDGQTPIENLPTMIDKLNQGYDVVSAKYMTRHQPSLFRRLGSILNRKMSHWLIEEPEGVNVSIFLVLKRFVVDEIVKYKEPFPYMSGLVLRVTQNIGNVEMEQAAREVGQSGYTLKKLLSLWVNGFTSFSIKPLRIATFIGGLCASVGFISAIVIIVQKLILDNIQTGWSSLISVLLIIGGLIMLMLGIMGEYLGRIYLCINHTPQYVVRNICGNVSNGENNDETNFEE